ncbi:MAG: nucleotidyl transferase AbiEii/AbiGii toxin family protein [Pseudomonadota bacterium]
MLIKPKVDILPQGQKEIFPLLRQIPEHFVLYGGTAIALRFGHRESVDFDLFTTDQSIDLVTTGKNLPFMKQFEEEKKLLIKKHNDGHVDFIVSLYGEQVQISFINLPEIIAGAVNSPDKMLGNNLRIASPVDLMAGKILAMHRRTDPKDYFDMYELVKRGVSLQKGYEATYAIAKLSPKGTDKLLLQNLNAEFSSKTVKRIVAESDLPIISAKAEECFSVLSAAAKSISIEKIEKTRIRAQRPIATLKTSRSR